MTEHQVVPEDGVASYLRSRHDVTQSTLDNHKYRLGLFTDWCELEDVSTLAELTGYDLQKYKNWRVNGESAPDCELVTIQQHLHSLRVFLQWAESSELVAEGLADKVIIPTVSDDEKARDVAITHERADAIIEYLRAFEWASREHIIFHLLYHTGMRRSGLHSLDVDDWHPADGYLLIEHRPEEGTRLKQGQGDREVSILDSTLASALDDYIENQRPQVTDDYGREPLIATTHGRMHSTTLTKVVYKVTRPCYYSRGCPVDREIEACAATTSGNYSKCPESVSPHPIRRSAITHSLSKNIPKDIVSGRCAVSVEVLDVHYDARDAEQRRKNREAHLDNL